jgi:hypothetical protein
LADYKLIVLASASAIVLAAIVGHLLPSLGETMLMAGWILVLPLFMATGGVHGRFADGESVIELLMAGNVVLYVALAFCLVWLRRTLRRSN